MDWYGMTTAELSAWCVAQDLPRFRGAQIAAGLARGAESFAAIKGLPRELAERLDHGLPLQAPVEDRRQESRDGTVKSLLRLRDGKLVECVSIPTATRHTVCVSSQVGCAVGCSFCASGMTGVERDLTAGEIVWQVLHHHRRRPVTNVVFMGSGEPLFNYDRVIQAIRVLGDPGGANLGRRRFTVSTSGVPKRIRQIGRDEPQITLALSLHAADDATRDRLVPLNRRWPLGELMAAMADYANTVNRRMTLEYVLLADANMTPGHAASLADTARRFDAHINLIPFNPVIEMGHRRPSTDEVVAFAAQVEAAGGHATVRGQRGADIDAACGQLRKRAMGAGAEAGGVAETGSAAAAVAVVAPADDGGEAAPGERIPEQQVAPAGETPSSAAGGAPEG
jgi:23S rRNA (adenine2503-C2)-methyltransferase